MKSYKCLLLVMVFIVGLFVQNNLTATSEKEIKENLLHIKIIAETPLTIYELRQKGFDVLGKSNTDSTIDLIVSNNELKIIKNLGLKIIWRERGRPLKEVFKISKAGAAIDKFPTGYQDYNGIINQMNDIASTYPEIARVVDISTEFNCPLTYEGRHLYGMKISDNVGITEDEEAVLIVSNEHAREVGTHVISLYTMEQLIANYASDTRVRSVIDSQEIWIIPVLNPDGYEHVFNVDNMWRKNRHQFSDGIGVDLNRNFPIGWDNGCSGSEDINLRIYKGPSPLSESESQTIVKLQKELNISKYLDFHSYGREVVFSYSTCSSHPWGEWLKSVGNKLSLDLGYNKSRPPSASGEIYHWMLSKGVLSFLVETERMLSPSYQMALDEAELLWPGVLTFIEDPTPLSGQVLDAYSETPVVNAVFEFKGVPFTNGELFNSGKNGRFQFNLPTGTYTLKISADGYSPDEKVIVVAEENQTQLNIKLNPILHSVDGLTCRQVSNNSILQTEYINLLSWEANPVNNGNDIVGYNIYEMIGSEKIYIGQVVESVFRYIHRDQNMMEKKKYGVTVLDHDGNESSLKTVTLSF